MLEMSSDFTSEAGEKQTKERTSRRQSQKSLKIERNVPLPGFRSAASQAILEAMQRCAKGDCFLVPIDEGTTRQSVMMAIMRNKKALRPKNFTARTADGGIRVWRIE